MSVILRRAELDSEAAALLSLLQRELSPSVDQRRLNWLYRVCPHGEAHVWVAAEADSRTLVGVAAVFPRKVIFGSGAVNGFVLGDFCVSARHRSLGLAVRLQRRCLEEVEQGGFVAGYDLPSNAMLAVYRRLGRQPGSQMVRLVKMLRADSWIAARTKSTWPAKLLSPAANTVLRIGRGSLRLKSGTSVRVQTERFGEEHTALARGIGAGLGPCVERSAAYLNWRYFDHPQHQYEVLAARREGRLQGYLVFQRENGIVRIVDWFGEEPSELRKDLVRGLISLCQQNASEAVHACVLASHSYYTDLCSLGFRARESSPVMFFETARESPSGHHPFGNWLLLDGDRES